MNTPKHNLASVILLAIIPLSSVNAQQNPKTAAYDPTDAVADAASAAADAVADALAADPYNEGGYDSLTKAIAIFRSRGNPTDERWISVVRMPKDLWREADLRTVKVEGEIRTIWEIIPNPDGGSFRTRQKYDCAQGTFTMLVLVRYFDNGDSEDIPISRIEAKTPVPGTIAESMLDWVCAK